MKDESAPQHRSDLIHEITQAYLDLFIMMQSVTMAHWLSFELTFAQGKAAILLAAHKELTVSQLAKLLGIGKPAASVLVQQLFERGLVTRTESQQDRRQSVVRLSEKGAEIGAGRLKQREVRWQHLLNRLSDEELDALGRGINALREGMRLESVEDSAGREPENRTLLIDRAGVK